MIKKNDFIQIEYTGKVKDDDLIFDTTDEKTAKDNEIFEQKAKYGAVTICIGQGHVLPGLDNELEGKEVGKEYNIVLQPEAAFGKKSAQLIQLVSMKKFKENDIMPQPGMQVNIDNSMGIVKTVSGGRILVDFNHPLSSKVIEYTVKIIQKIDDVKEQLESLLKMMLGIEVKTEVSDGKATVEMPAVMPEEINKEISKNIKEIIPSLKEIEFKKKEEKKVTAKKEENKE